MHEQFLLNETLLVLPLVLVDDVGVVGEKLVLLSISHVSLVDLLIMIGAIMSVGLGFRGYFQSSINWLRVSLNKKAPIAFCHLWMKVVHVYLVSVADLIIASLLQLHGVLLLRYGVNVEMATPFCLHSVISVMIRALVSSS